ncbi:MAG: DUF4365 domain-containing protein [Cyanobacteria bacterium]|nr:DUF4365 domain-containing protein [Cyanobacteria bacterium bin.275]
MPDPLQEDRGLTQVHQACVEMGAIWRPTPCHDLGIDGQMEFLDNTDSVVSTGKIVAVQVKSGPSYFTRQTTEGFVYYPSRRHRSYWARLTLPVLLVLHDPSQCLTIYTEVRKQLNNDGPLIVPADSIFDGSARRQLLEACDFENRPEPILRKLALLRVPFSPKDEITGIDLYISCISTSSDIFAFSIARICELTEILSTGGLISFGPRFYEGIHRFLLIMMGAKLTEDFTEAFETQWYGSEQVPVIEVLFTVIGQRVNEALLANLVEYVEIGRYAHIAELQTEADLEKFIRRRAGLADTLSRLDYPMSLRSYRDVEEFVRDDAPF